MKRISIIAVMVWLALPLAAQAADFSQAASETKRDLAQARQEQAQTAQEIKQSKQELERRLSELENKLAAQKERLARAGRELAQARQTRVELSERLDKQSGDFRELSGNIRAAARDLLALAERSPVSAEDPGRLVLLRSYLDKGKYPGLTEIKKLIDLCFAEMEDTGQISSRLGTLVDRQGQNTPARLVRLGGFCTLYEHEGELGFAALGPASGSLLAINGDLPWGVERSLKAYLGGESDTVYLDISGGAALRQLSRRMTLWEQLLSGGPLVWPILFVGLVALVLILERLIFLQRVRSNTDGLMSRVTGLVAEGDFKGALQEVKAQPGRPTSNVIQAGLALKGCSLDAVEGGLSEAMLRELPRLERFLTALKVLAAVAPLLGLLGTVTGMINTFHVITAFGAGDPRLMAGGISEALVTTQLGLAVAIPIMVAAALLGRKAQRITGDMEEKAVALSAALIRRED